MRLLRRLVLFACLLSSVILPRSSRAQAPGLINYQGRVVNGTNLVNGSIALSLRLFNVPSGGSSQYEDSNSVTVLDGLYSTLLGDQTNSGNFASSLTNAEVYIEVAVNGSTLVPRERLASVAYAMRAIELDPLWSAASNGVATQVAAKADSNLVYSTFATAAALSTEQTTRSGADASLSNAVSTEATARIGADSSLSNAVSTETTARVGGDASLSNAVSAEATARIGADASLSNSVASLNTNVAARLLSTTWAAADSTTNYVHRTGDVMSGVLSNSSGFAVAGVGMPILSTNVADPALTNAGYQITAAANGNIWTEATTGAAWSARSETAALAFSNRMWVFGGSDAFHQTNDVWNTTNGTDWTEVTNSAAWTPRDGGASVVFSNRMWILGGYDGPTGTNDVWSSTNGVDWIQATGSAAWSHRAGHRAIVFNNRMWVLGGFDGVNRTNDVWSSADGATWTEATASAPWTSRYYHASIVFDNKMWVMGGLGTTSPYLNDVWWSADGTNWTEAAINAAWSPRSAFACVAFGGRMWVMGGDEGINKNDVYYSEDGANWTLVTVNSTTWPARRYPSATVFNQRMWVLGGYLGPTALNDVWSSGLTPVKIGPWYIYSR